MSFWECRSLDRLDEESEHLQKVMDEEGVEPRNGLPQELFLFATTLIPCPNIDLLITDDKHRLSSPGVKKSSTVKAGIY